MYSSFNISLASQTYLGEEERVWVTVKTVYYLHFFTEFKVIALLAQKFAHVVHIIIEVPIF